MVDVLFAYTVIMTFTFAILPPKCNHVQQVKAHSNADFQEN